MADGTTDPALAPRGLGARGPWSWAAPSLAIALFAAQHRYAWPQLGDDSFVFFRFAERLAAGSLSWSEGDPPVEGYSSPLWLLLLAGGVRLGLPVVGLAKALGTACTAAALAGAVTLASRLGAGSLQTAAAVGLLALTAGVHFWAASGLETALYSALFTWFAASLAGSGPGWVVPAMALGVARPEGPLLTAVAVGLVTARDRRFPPGLAALAQAPALVWEGFRLVAYGAPLPNTFYAKATGGGLRQVALGFGYVVGVVPAAVALWVGWRDRPDGRAALLALGWVFALLAVVIAGGGDWMWFGRLTVPALVVIVAVGAALWGPPLRARILAGLAAALLWPNAVPGWWVATALTGRPLPETAWQEGELSRASRELAEWLAERYPADTLVAVNHAGALPYFSGFRAIDMTGLCDPHIARRPGQLHGKYDPDYVLGREPDLVVLNARVRPGTDGVWYHPGYWEGETALVDHPGFARCYAPLEHRYASWRWAPTGDNYTLVYARTCP